MVGRERGLEKSAGGVVGRREKSRKRSGRVKVEQTSWAVASLSVATTPHQPTETLSLSLCITNEPRFQKHPHLPKPIVHAPSFAPRAEELFLTQAFCANRTPFAMLATTILLVTTTFTSQLIDLPAVRAIMTEI